MSGVNKVILVGRLGKDPDIRTFEQGVKKASFPLATSEIRKDKNGNRVELTEWHNIYCWRNLAEICEQYLSVGKMIYLEGKIRTRSWDDNGIRRYITEIEATTFTILSPKKESGPEAVTKAENMGDRGTRLLPGADAAEQPGAAGIEDEPSETDDLPF